MFSVLVLIFCPRILLLGGVFLTTLTGLPSISQYIAGLHLVIKIQIYFLCFELSCLHINFIMRNLYARYSLRVTPFLSDLQAVVPL